MILFYVPQIVQTLRADVLGYAEQYIIQMARSSQLFSHQVIWNMNANMYKDDDMLLVSCLASDHPHLHDIFESRIAGRDETSL